MGVYIDVMIDLIWNIIKSVWTKAEPGPLTLDTGIVRLPFPIERGGDVVRSQGECTMDYRTWMLAKQMVVCVPMNVLIDIIRRYCKDVVEGRLYTDDLIVPVDPVKMGLTKRAVAATLNYMVDNRISLVEGKDLPFTVSHGTGKHWSEADHREYCSALSKGDLLCYGKE